jgi:hypothetical protein
MLKVKMDTDRLSIDELKNISKALRGGCAQCIEEGVAEALRHPDEVNHFLYALADAIDGERIRREKKERDVALGVDPTSGEWEAGA